MERDIDGRCLLWSLSTVCVEECLFAPGIPFLCLPHAGNTGVLPCLPSFDVGPGIWALVPMVTSHTLYLLNHLSMSSTYLMNHIPMIKIFFFLKKRLSLNANLKSVKHGCSNIFSISETALLGSYRAPLWTRWVICHGLRIIIMSPCGMLKGSHIFSGRQNFLSQPKLGRCHSCCCFLEGGLER